MPGASQLRRLESRARAHDTAPTAAAGQDSALVRLCAALTPRESSTRHRPTGRAARGVTRAQRAPQHPRGTLTRSAATPANCSQLEPIGVQLGTPDPPQLAPFRDLERPQLAPEVSSAGEPIVR